jgi:xylan 1,4-beta-xylosidase
VRGRTDIGAIAAKDKRSATIMIWNYHDEDKQDTGEKIQLSISGLPTTTITVTEYRIDNEHSNSYEVWKKMGSPQNPTKEQVMALEKAGQLQKMYNKPMQVKTKREVTMGIHLPRQGVSLVKIDW